MFTSFDWCFLLLSAKLFVGCKIHPPKNRYIKINQCFKLYLSRNVPPAVHPSSSCPSSPFGNQAPHLRTQQGGCSRRAVQAAALSTVVFISYGCIMLTGASYSALNILAFDGDIHQTQIKKSFFVGEACRLRACPEIWGTMTLGIRTWLGLMDPKNWQSHSIKAVNSCEPQTKTK